MQILTQVLLMDRVDFPINSDNFFQKLIYSVLKNEFESLKIRFKTNRKDTKFELKRGRP